MPQEDTTEEHIEMDTMFIERSSKDIHFSIRSVVVGVIVGMLLCCSNMYFGLQTGWVTMGSLQSTLVGFLVFKLIGPKTPLGPKENVVLQSTAVATATLPLAAGFVGVIPALERLHKPVILTATQQLLWCFGLAFFGAFIAVPLRKGIILKEKLPFPSGTATAQMIKMLHGTAAPKQGDPTEYTPGYLGLSPVDNAEMGKKWRAFSVALGVSAVTSLVGALHARFANFYVLSWVGLQACTDWGWYWTNSFSYVGQGMIMGIRPALSMMAGAVMGWAMLGPYAHYKGWAYGDITKSSEQMYNGKGWLTWVALAIMLAESIVSLIILISKSFYKKYKDKKSNEEDDEDDESDPAPEHQQVPPQWWISGLIISSILCVVMMVPLFETTVVELIIAVLISFICSILAVRALGTTDLNPVSGLAKISQIIFAALSPNVVSNLVAGAVAEAGAQQAGDMMQDLKTGHLIHASPRAQFYGQLIGSFFSVFTTVGAYKLYTTAFSGTRGFDMPMAAVWLDMADLVTGHHGILTKLHVAPCCIVFGVAAGLLPIISEVVPSSRKYLPSGVAFAVGFIVTPNWTLVRVLGSLVQYFWSKHAPSSHEKYMIVVASGFVLGEGCMSIVTAFLKLAM